MSDGKTLLYVGISPKQTSRQGKPSTQTIWHRIRYHYRGNAEGSTLRLTLGCLLSDQLGVELRRVGSGKRMTFHEGEQKINEWMQENAFVTWISHLEPWKIEDQAIRQLSLPLNLKDNKRHPFQRKRTFSSGCVFTSVSIYSTLIGARAWENRGITPSYLVRYPRTSNWVSTGGSRTWRRP